MSEHERRAQQVFGERAAWYTTSQTHADAAVLDRVVDLAGPRGDSLALDVATGTGHTAFALARRALAVIGVDFTPEMIAEGRRLQAQRGIANVRFVLADVDDLPFGDGGFDVVT